jgi:anti-anti-sigma factor
VLQTDVICRPGDGYVAVRVAGDVDTGTRAQLSAALDRAVTAGTLPVVVDLTDVRFFAAAGVHCVEMAVGAIEARGGAAHLVCPRPGAAWRVVSLLGLDRQWLVHQDVADAVAGCSAGASARVSPTPPVPQQRSRNVVKARAPRSVARSTTSDR